MGRKKDSGIYPHVSYVSIDNAPPIRWDSLSQEKRTELSEKMMEKVSDNLSRYIKSHPEELESLT